MPTRYAALVWDRVLYLDELDAPAIYEFFTTYAERVADDGSWIAPPEPQCAAPSPSPEASAAASPSRGPSAGARARRPRPSVEASPSPAAS